MIPLFRPVTLLHRDRWYSSEEVKEANRRVNQARKFNRRAGMEQTWGLLRAAIRNVKAMADTVQEKHWPAW